MNYLSNGDQSYAEEAAVREVAGAPGPAGVAIAAPTKIDSRALAARYGMTLEAVQQARRAALMAPSRAATLLPAKVTMESAKDNLQRLNYIRSQVPYDTPEFRQISSQANEQRDIYQKLKNEHMSGVISQAKSIAKRITRMVDAGWSQDSAGLRSINKAKAEYQELVKDIPTQEQYAERLDINLLFGRKILDRIESGFDDPSRVFDALKNFASGITGRPNW